MEQGYDERRSVDDFGNGLEFFNKNKIMKKLTLLVGIFTASLCAWANNSLKLSGSDIIAPIIEKEVLALSKKSGIDVTCDMRGSYLGLPALQEGKTDVAIIALPRGKKLPEGLVAFSFCYQVAVVVVNSINPIEEINTMQLYNIYSSNTKTRYETWANLGISDVSLRNIMAVTTSFYDSIVIELFKAEAINGTNLGSWVNMVYKKSDLLNIIKTNNSAIAVLGKTSKSDMVKILPVAKSGGEKIYAYRPDIESIFNGDYPLTIPFYVVCKKENVKKVKPLIKILLDDKIATLLDNSDFYAAPKNSRKNSIFELDISK